MYYIRNLLRSSCESIVMCDGIKSKIKSTFRFFFLISTTLLLEISHSLISVYIYFFTYDLI